MRNISTLISMSTQYWNKAVADRDLFSTGNVQSFEIGINTDWD
jgi:hypothetical protein